MIRVVCRVFALAEDPKSARARRRLEEIVTGLISKDRPGDFNQALMELGARVCLAREPLCAQCPLRALCKAAQQGNPESYPLAVAAQQVESVEEACAVVRWRNRYLVARCPVDSGRYRNMWEFPRVIVQEDQDARKALLAYLEERFDLKARVDEEWAAIRHQVTHHKILKRVFLCSCRNGGQSDDLGEESDVLWAGLDAMDRLPMGAPHKRIRDLLRESDNFLGGASEQ